MFKNIAFRFATTRGPGEQDPMNIDVLIIGAVKEACFTLSGKSLSSLLVKTSAAKDSIWRAG